VELADQDLLVAEEVGDDLALAPEIFGPDIEKWPVKTAVAKARISRHTYSRSTPNRAGNAR
jgi:hypothetical protein